MRPSSSGSHPSAQHLATPEWLDRMYNNRALVPDHAGYFERWQAKSLQVRAERSGALDIPYASGGTVANKQTLDVFAAATPGAPVVVFIHGGYWRSLDKSDHSFVVPALASSGACVVVPNYGLCPQTDGKAVTVADIVLQMVQALAWTWRNVARFNGDRQRISVIGHSAGGHLAAMLLNCQWPRVGADLPAAMVRKALSISGLYELEPVRRTPFLQASLQLSVADAQRASPALLPTPQRGILFTVAGALESAEFLRHNQLIRDCWGTQAVPVCEALPGLNHFSVLDALVQPGHRLHALAHDLMLT